VLNSLITGDGTRGLNAVNLVLYYTEILGSDSLEIVMENNVFITRSRQNITWTRFNPLLLTIVCYFLLETKQVRFTILRKDD
jgi:hypothetical protein